MMRALLGGKKKASDPQYQGCLHVWKKLGCSEKDLQRLKKVFTKADRDGSGSLDLFEFLMYADLDKTPLSRKVFELFDYDDSRQMSFKEFAFAVWNFNTLDYPGLGRFTFQVFNSKEGAGIDQAGIGRFCEDVFGEGIASAVRSKVEDDLQRLRRAEGGKILCPAWEGFVVKAQSSLDPLFQLHRKLQKRTLGVASWEKLQRQRTAMFGKLEWPEISKNMKALELPENDRDIHLYEEEFWNLVKDAYHTFERDGALKLSQTTQALEFFGAAMNRCLRDLGDEHPTYVDILLVQEEIDALNEKKVRAKKRDGKLSSDEWEACFRKVWEAKEVRRKNLQDVHPPAKHRKRRRRKKTKVAAADRDRVDFVVPPRAHVPPTRPQSAPSIRDQTAFETLVKQECAVIQRERTTRRVTYAHWCRHDGDRFHVESAEAKVPDGRKAAPGGMTFFTPSSNARTGKLNEGADEYKRDYVDAPLGQRWRHGANPNAEIDVLGDRNARRRSLLASGASAAGGASVRSGSVHAESRAGASSYSDPSLRCGRGGVEMRWDLTVRTMSSGGSSKTARSTRRPRSASASYGAAGYRIEKQGFVGAVDHRHHRAMM